jgi:hypothetical protein
MPGVHTLLLLPLFLSYLASAFGWSAFEGSAGGRAFAADLLEKLLALVDRSAALPIC